jgi:MFS family permease
MAGERGLRSLFCERWFPRLFTTRVVSQTADGLFQASLAGAVFFNPDHQTDPKQAAAGFVVLLLPYSLVGPFAGVFLDRWRRQRVLVLANFVRSVFIAATVVVLLTHGSDGFAFYVAALAALSVNRFYLSALSAALPHVVRRRQLLLANSVTTTTGTAVTISGLGLALLMRHGVGSADDGNALIALASIAVYIGASGVATTMPGHLLGPEDEPAPLGAALQRVGADMLSGARHVTRRAVAGRVLLAVAASRLLFGMSTIGTLLLYRNYFHDDGALRAGLVGLGQVFASSALGYVVAAVATPVVTARVTKQQCITGAFVLAGLTQLGFGLPFEMGPLLAGAFFLGLATQAAKICADTIVQEQIEDDFRGRVFSFYDTMFNLTFVAAAVVAAFAMPTSGRSYPVLLAIGAGYLVIAGIYASAEGRGTEAVSPPGGATARTTVSD